MIFSYRTRQWLRRLLSALLPALLVIVAVLVCWLFWLQRFVVYTPDGVHFDFNLTSPAQPGIEPQPATKGDVEIEYDTTLPNESRPPFSAQLPPKGYYIDAELLQTDVDAVITQLQKLPAGTAVLLDVKNYWGSFFYSTTLREQASSAYNIPQMDVLLAYLASSDLYAIARLPALRDYTYALNNTECGLATGQGYLWEDSGKCYWLDPTQEGTLSFLIQVTRELRTLGFDEVVFTHFYVPESRSIVFDADRKEAIEAAAATLVCTCASEQFTVSFALEDLMVALPQQYCRLYLSGVAAADVLYVLEQVSLANPEANVVFLAEANDTRYEQGGVLRPLKLAH